MADEEEISLAIVAILAVGTTAMLALLGCYIRVFRQLCCQPPPTSRKRNNDELQMVDTTQNLEFSVTTATEYIDQK